MQAAPVTRLPSRWMLPARIAWFLIFLLAVWKLVIGTPLIYAEKQVVCTAPAEVCAEGISPSQEEIQTLEASGISSQEYAFLVIAFRIIQVVIWVGMGVMIFLLRSDDWLALIVSAMLILFTTGYASDPITRAYPSLGWLAQLGFSLQNAFLFLFIGLFPSGQFAPRWLRGYWMGMIVLALTSYIAESLIPALDWLWLPIWLSFLTLGPYSQIFRYRKESNPAERMQTRWVVFGFAAMAVFIPVVGLLTQISFLPGIVMEDFFFGLGALALPFSIGISVLRYRLWDIDVVIRRTLVYAALTLTLALVFFGAATVLQSLFVAISGQQSAVSVVISTLLIAALIAPLRLRIQNGIDRRFYRKKYDAEKTLEQFAASLRDEVDLDDLQNRLVTVVEETLQPERLSLWLRQPNFTSKGGYDHGR